MSTINESTTIILFKEIVKRDQLSQTLSYVCGKLKIHEFNGKILKDTKILKQNAKYINGNSLPVLISMLGLKTNFLIF